jgi:hypothetical protein
VQILHIGVKQRLAAKAKLGWRFLPISRAMLEPSAFCD